MGSQILRPTATKGQKGEWVVQGSWGKRRYGPKSNVHFYEELFRELQASGVLSEHAAAPSRRHHDHVTTEVMRCSWMGDRWIQDEAFCRRLRSLREAAKVTQEDLAARSGLDVGTIRQLEQGTRTKPQWQSVCALARGLEVDVAAFVGTEGWQPAGTEGDPR